MPHPHASGDEGAEAEHRREVERVRADHDTDCDGVLVLDERRDRRRDLGRIGRERREQAEERLRQAEPQSDAVEALRELRGREQHHRDRDDEEGDGEGGRHRFSPTRLPGTPGRTLAQKYAIIRL